MVYRKSEKPRWRSAAVTHQVAARLLESAGHKPDWVKADRYMLMKLSDLDEAVTVFLNRLHDAGVSPHDTRVVFHPETGRMCDGDWRSSYTVFYYGLMEVSPTS